VTAIARDSSLYMGADASLGIVEIAGVLARRSLIPASVRVSLYCAAQRSFLVFAENR
jgi:hypothetical protein